MNMESTVRRSGRDNQDYNVWVRRADFKAPPSAFRRAARVHARFVGEHADTGRLIAAAGGD